MGFYLIEVSAQGSATTRGPYPSGAAQKDMARALMRAGSAVFYLDIGIDGSPSVGKVLAVDGKMETAQRLRVEVLP